MGCSNGKNRKTVWKSETLPERRGKHHHLFAAPGEINNPYWLLEVLVSYGLLCVYNIKMTYSYFMSKMEPLSLRTSHAACTFLFPNKLNSLHKLSIRFWTLDVTYHWLQSQWRGSSLKWDATCYSTSPFRLKLLGMVQFVLPLLRCLGPFLWDCLVLLLEMVWSLLKSVPTLYIFKITYAMCYMC